MLVADVMSHHGLPVRQVLTLALCYWTVEGFTRWQFSGQPLFKVCSSYKIFSINFVFQIFSTLRYLDGPVNVDKDSWLSLQIYKGGRLAGFPSGREQFVQ